MKELGEKDHDDDEKKERDMEPVFSFCLSRLPD